MNALVYTLIGTAADGECVGLTGWSAYPVFWLEAVGGSMLVIGHGTRLVKMICPS